MEGFGEKSCENLLQSIEESRTRELYRFLNALGIPGIGAAGAKLLAKSFGYQLEAIMEADAERLAQIDGIGPVLADAVVCFFQQKENQNMIADLLRYIEFKPEAETDQKLRGMNFVITGSLQHFENRNELKALLEAKGAKVTDSVSQKTTYLINNDPESHSSKNQKAKKLNIPILNETELLNLLEKWK